MLSTLDPAVSLRQRKSKFYLLLAIEIAHGNDIARFELQRDFLVNFCAARNGIVKSNHLSFFNKSL